jgi:hypothetical protein
MDVGTSYRFDTVRLRELQTMSSSGARFRCLGNTCKEMVNIRILSSKLWVLYTIVTTHNTALTKIALLPSSIC